MPTYKDAERGTWYVDVRYKDNAGRSQRKKKRGFKTQREAKAWEREFLLAKHGFDAKQTHTIYSTFGAIILYIVYPLYDYQQAIYRFAAELPPRHRLQAAALICWAVLDCVRAIIGSFCHCTIYTK